MWNISPTSVSWWISRLPPTRYSGGLQNWDNMANHLVRSSSRESSYSCIGRQWGIAIPPHRERAGKKRKSQANLNATSLEFTFLSSAFAARNVNENFLPWALSSNGACCICIVSLTCPDLDIADHVCSLRFMLVSNHPFNFTSLPEQY